MYVLYIHGHDKNQQFKMVFSVIAKSTDRSELIDVEDQTDPIICGGIINLVRNRTCRHVWWIMRRGQKRHETIYINAMEASARRIIDPIDGSGCGSRQNNEANIDLEAAKRFRRMRTTFVYNHPSIHWHCQSTRCDQKIEWIHAIRTI